MPSPKKPDEPEKKPTLSAVAKKVAELEKRVKALEALVPVPNVKILPA